MKTFGDSYMPDNAGTDLQWGYFDGKLRSIVTDHFRGEFPACTSTRSMVALLLQCIHSYVSRVHRGSFPAKVFTCIHRLPPPWYLVSAAARKSFNDRRRVRSAKISDTVSLGNRFHAIIASFSSIVAF